MSRTTLAWIIAGVVAVLLTTVVLKKSTIDVSGATATDTSPREYGSRENMPSGSPTRTDGVANEIAVTSAANGGSPDERENGGHGRAFRARQARDAPAGEAPLPIAVFRTAPAAPQFVGAEHPNDERSRGLGVRHAERSRLADSVDATTHLESAQGQTARQGRVVSMMAPLLQWHAPSLFFSSGSGP